jgi:hypothetical protein
MGLWNHVLKGVKATSAINSTVWTVDFETPVCKLNSLFISASAAQEKEKKRRK